MIHLPRSIRALNKACAIRPALTIAELVVSMAVMSVLLMGLASAMLIASHALPHNSITLQTGIDSAAIVNQIVDELRTAIWMIDHTATELTFTVAADDRDGDHVPERIHYEWSGTAGDPLVRTCNGGTPVSVLDDVRELALFYDTVTETETYPGPPVESGVNLLSSYDDFWDDKDYKIEDDKWCGQYFEPEGLPTDAVSWAVKTVYFRAKRENNDNDLTWVQMRLPNADGTPAETVLEQHDMYESALADWYTWIQCDFSQTSGLDPGQGACLVFQHCGAGGHSAKIEYEDDWGTGYLKTEHAGADWTIDTERRSLYYYAYGTYSTPGPAQTSTRTYVTNVRLTLRSGADTSTRITSAAPLLNYPELLSGLWQADFTVDPSTDLNGDGHGDWGLVGGGAVDLQALIDADRLHTAGSLRTAPNSSFAHLTTVELTFHDTTTSGSGAGFAIMVDWGSGQCAPIYATLQLLADRTQSLMVYHMRDAATKAQLVTVSGLPDSPVNLRLLIDPAHQTVNITINDSEYNTFTYNRVTATGDHARRAILIPDSSGCEYSSVSIRVSE